MGRAHQGLREDPHVPGDPALAVGPSTLVGGRGPLSEPPGPGGKAPGAGDPHINPEQKQLETPTRWLGSNGPLGWGSCQGKGVWEGLCPHPMGPSGGNQLHTHFLSHGHKQRHALWI